MYIQSLIAFLSILFITIIVSKPGYAAIEGLENKDGSCSSEVSTIVYKNAGAITNLEKGVDDMMKKVNNIVISNDTQTSEINKLKESLAVTAKTATEADQASKENKKNILKYANQAKGETNQAAAKQSNLKPI